MFEDIKENQLNEINGGGLATAAAGGLAGFVFGAVCVAGAAIHNDGNLSGKSVWKIMSSSTLGGAGLGSVVPLP